MDGCNTRFPLGWPIFRCFVSFSELLVQPLGLKFRQSHGSCSFNKKWGFFSLFSTYIEKHMVKGCKRCYMQMLLSIFFGGGLNTLEGLEFVFRRRVWIPRV